MYVNFDILTLKLFRLRIQHTCAAPLPLLLVGLSCVGWLISGPGLDDLA